MGKAEAEGQAVGRQVVGGEQLAGESSTLTPAPNPTPLEHLVPPLQCSNLQHLPLPGPPMPVLHVVPAPHPLPQCSTCTPWCLPHFLPHIPAATTFSYSPSSRPISTWEKEHILAQVPAQPCSGGCRGGSSGLRTGSVLDIRNMYGGAQVLPRFLRQQWGVGLQPAGGRAKQQRGWRHDFSTNSGVQGCSLARASTQQQWWQ